MSGTTRVAVVVGNPKPKSRTYEAALLVGEQVTGLAPTVVIDVVDLGAGLLDWEDPAVAEAVQAVRDATVLIVASPTFKATYTGLLKLFLDRFPNDALAGTVAIPLMLGAGPGHALAPEIFLKHVLVELGATCPTRALYIIDRDYRDPAALEGWLVSARPQVAAALAGLTGAP